MVTRLVSILILTIIGAGVEADDSADASAFTTGAQLLGDGEYSEAAKVFDAAIDAISGDDLLAADMATRVGMLFADSGKRLTAIEYLDRSYAILTKATFVDPDPIGEELLTLGAAFARANQIEKARELFQIASMIRASTDAPIPIHRGPPIYPSDCLAEGVSGSVTVEYDVDEEGHVRGIKAREIETSYDDASRDSSGNPCGNSMANAARNAASEFRYVPKVRKGTPVYSKDLEARITFDLD